MYRFKCALLALIAAAPAGAVELADGKISLNGFGRWAMSSISSGNAYLSGLPGSNFGDATAGVALHAAPAERARIGLQVRFRSNQVTSLDWAFGEWRFSDMVRLRIGLVQHPFGISGDVRDVGTLRPFYFLPTSVYGRSSFTAEAVRGATVHGDVYGKGGWSLGYDAYFGDLTMNDGNPYAHLLAGLKPGGKIATVVDDVPFLGGGRVVLTAPGDKLSFRLSGYSRLKGGDGVVGASLQYLGDGIDIRGEYFFHVENEGPASRTHVAYIEGSVFLTDHVQAGLRGEIFRGELLGYSGSRALLDHGEVAATLNYWFTHEWAVKASLHLIDGNRFAHPDGVDDAILAGTLQRRTQALFIGTQFSF
jgi:hypothetical protein